MYNILSVDFDFVMEPCIQLYNDFIHTLANYSQLWDEIFSKTHCEKFLKINEDNYSFLLSVLSKLQCPVYIGVDHTNILRSIDERYGTDTIHPTFSITNIDHHHDILYSNRDLPKLKKYNFPQAGTWVGYLWLQQVLHSYRWIRNENSQLYDNNLNLNFPDFSSDTKEGFNIDNSNLYDMCYISLSVEWIPPQSIPVLIEFLKTVKQIFPTITWYDGDYLSYQKFRGIAEKVFA